MADPREVNPTVQPQTWSAVQRLMALRPDDRPASAAEARAVLGLGQPESVAAEEKMVQPGGRGKRCAVCDLRLRPVMSDGIEIDVCNECGGVWLDRGELGRLVQMGRQAPAPAPSRSPGFQGTDDLSGPLDSGDLRAEHNDSRRLRYGGRRRSAFDRDERGKPARSQPSRFYQVWKLLEKMFD